MLLPPNIVGEGIMFLGIPPTSFVTISHERFEQSWWKLSWIFSNPYWWPDWILEV